MGDNHFVHSVICTGNSVGVGGGFVAPVRLGRRHWGGRAGINSVAKGQWEAAAAIGMSRTQAYRYIILPQSVRFMLPPLTGEVVHLIKSSAIVSVIAVAELTTLGRNIISDTYMSFEIWFTVAALYLILTLILSFGVSLLENKFTTPS